MNKNSKKLKSIIDSDDFDKLNNFFNVYEGNEGDLIIEDKPFLFYAIENLSEENRDKLLDMNFDFSVTYKEVSLAEEFYSYNDNELAIKLINAGSYFNPNSIGFFYENCKFNFAEVILEGNMCDPNEFFVNTYLVGLDSEKEYSYFLSKTDDDLVEYSEEVGEKERILDYSINRGHLLIFKGLLEKDFTMEELNVGILENMSAFQEFIPFASDYDYCSILNEITDESYHYSDDIVRILIEEISPRSVCELLQEYGLLDDIVERVNSDYCQCNELFKYLSKDDLYVMVDRVDEDGVCKIIENVSKEVADKDFVIKCLDKSFASICYIDIDCGLLDDKDLLYRYKKNFDSNPDEEEMKLFESFAYAKDNLARFEREDNLLKRMQENNAKNSEKQQISNTLRKKI